MKVGTKEHYEMMEEFEKWACGRFDKEPKEFWSKGMVYQNGEINEQFRMFCIGYSVGRQKYM